MRYGCVLYEQSPEFRIKIFEKFSCVSIDRIDILFYNDAYTNCNFRVWTKGRRFKLLFFKRMISGIFGIQKRYIMIFVVSF